MKIDDQLPPTDPVEYQKWLDGIVPLDEGARLRGVHVDTLKRQNQHKHILVRRSKRLWGIRRRVALMLGD
jgi:hypothetical protein